MTVATSVRALMNYILYPPIPATTVKECVRPLMREKASLYSINVHWDAALTRADISASHAMDEAATIWFRLDCGELFGDAPDGTAYEHVLHPTPNPPGTEHFMRVFDRNIIQAA